MVAFREVSLFGEKSAKCACGRRRTRRKKFWQTVNPFNKNDSGRPKTAGEIRKELEAEYLAWKRDPITCATCPTPSTIEQKAA